MKRVGYLYEKMLNLDLIKLAIRKAAQGKTARGYIAVVLNDIDSHAQKIKAMLESESVMLSPNRQITLYDRSCEKTRLITVPKFYPDQIIHWVVMLVLEPVIKKGMYRYSCGSIPNRGGMEAKRYVERVIREDKARYVAKLDISKFFNNVKPAILMTLFRRKIKDEKFLRLIFGTIRPLCERAVKGAILHTVCGRYGVIRHEQAKTPQGCRGYERIPENKSRCSTEKQLSDMENSQPPDRLCGIPLL